MSVYLVDRALRPGMLRYGKHTHAVPRWYDPDAERALCGLVPRRGWERSPFRDYATPANVTCLLCRARLMEVTTA